MGKLEPGDGHSLQPFRWWQPFTRSLLHLRLHDGEKIETWSVDLRLGGDSNGTVWAQLYRDGFHEAKAKPPARFDVPGGTIDIATSGYGLKRANYVAANGTVRQLTPDPASAEGWRAWLDRRHPVLSWTISATSIVVLLVALVLGIPQLIETVTSIPFVAEHVGTFVSPIHLPAWLNTSLFVGAILASTERALRFRYSRILDSGLFDGDD